MNVKDVKRLRELTGCGVMEARRALEAAGGDVGRAAEAVWAVQRERPPERPAQAGGVFQYRHHDGRLGSMVVLACGTDFVARSPLFCELGEALALQVAAMAPRRRGGSPGPDLRQGRLEDDPVVGRRGRRTHRRERAGPRVLPLQGLRSRGRP